RFDYNPISMLLSARMPNPVHDFFTAFVAEISRQLEVISHHGDSSAEFASQVANGGCARIFLKEANLDGDEYPGVVLEISYSQDGKDLKTLAWDYIQFSNGDVKVVVGIDIKHSNTKEATLSV
ncbi:hypothetical protein BJ875DRAFT_388192, partial [Amylocarpus encephaloides]